MTVYFLFSSFYSNRIYCFVCVWNLKFDFMFFTMIIISDDIWSISKSIESRWFVISDNNVTKYSAETRSWFYCTNSFRKFYVRNQLSVQFELINIFFRTYKEVELCPGPRLNVIIGPNGSGYVWDHFICEMNINFY